MVPFWAWKRCPTHDAGVRFWPQWHWLAIRSSRRELAVGRPIASTRVQTNAIWAPHVLSLAILNAKGARLGVGGGRGTGLRELRTAHIKRGGTLAAQGRRPGRARGEGGTHAEPSVELRLEVAPNLLLLGRVDHAARRLSLTRQQACRTRPLSSSARGHRGRRGGAVGALPTAVAAAGPERSPINCGRQWT